jgi:phospholipase C
MRPTRRAFAAMLVTGVALWLGGITPASASRARASQLAPVVDPSIVTTTPLRHFVSVMQENHTFDNYFAGYRGTDAPPAKTCIPIDPAGLQSKDCVSPFRVGKRPIQNLASGVVEFEAAFAKGAMNGFSAAQSSRGIPVDLPMGYYDDRDIPYYWNLADQYVLFDRFFTSIGGGSVWNHMYWATGTPGDTTREAVPPTGFPNTTRTIFDDLQAKGVSWKFYVQNYDPSITYKGGRDTKRGAQVPRVPLLAIPRVVESRELMSHIAPLDDYFTDLQHGRLPAVSYIVPSGSSEHPPGSIQSGQSFLRNIINSLQQSSAWPSSALLLTYDSWGGWYDHVAPPAGYGFRTPALLVSAMAKKGVVDHTQLDFTSILHFIQRNWSLPALPGQRPAVDFGNAFAFNAPARQAAFVGAARHPAVTPAPTRGIIYLAYGGAIGIAVALVAGAVVVTLRRNRAIETA